MYTIGDASLPDAYWFEYPTSELNNLATTSAPTASTQGQAPTIIRPGIMANPGDIANGVMPSNGPTFSVECGSPLLQFKLFDTSGVD